ncbi:MAG: type I DNA topoisomerase, partial [Thermodesulfovibrionales bacterium]
GIDEKNDFKPQYVIIPGKEKVIKELKKESKDAKNIYLATDPDREGEAIAFHIAEEIKGGKKGKNGTPIYRVTFHEITSKAVKEAIQNPTDIDINKVNAQQARRILDRLVGYKLSPFLWKKIRRGLSAGRVQSVALRLIVEREREIEGFIPEEYWTVEGLFTPDVENGSKTFKSELYKYKGNLIIDRDADKGKRFLIKDNTTAKEICEALSKSDYLLKSVEKKIRKRSPYPPFITSTLQQEASVKLKFSAKKTMQIAQQLYEGLDIGDEGAIGLITYMRTDSFRVAPEAQRWAGKYIRDKYGDEYLPDTPPIYRSKGNAQDAHEAIRPTYPDKTPDAVKRFLNKDQYNLYSLIWNRFIASQMSPAQYDQTTFIITPVEESLKDTEFRVTGSILRFAGFLAVYATDDPNGEDGQTSLPDIKEGSALILKDLQSMQHFTQPPPRYSEATLVKTLEEKGIGRPSTYATILSTIQDRKYTTKDDGRFRPTELGVLVNDLLVEKFPDLMDYQFTANMEEELDDIESAKLDWIKVIREFYEPFSLTLKQAEDDREKIKPEDIPTDEVCDKCGSPMVIRWGRHGRFYACSSYPQCKNTRPLESEQQENLQTDEVCDKCGNPMIIKNGRYGRFLACSNYPKCKNAKPLTTGLKCPVDNGDIIQRNTKKGKVFWSCSNYPNCKFATWDRPINETCPSCGSSVLFEKSTKGGGKIRYCQKDGCSFKEGL